MRLACLPSLSCQLLANDVVDPALRAFAVTNLDKDPRTGRWEWRVNIDCIHRSMSSLAQFDLEAAGGAAGTGGIAGIGGIATAGAAARMESDLAPFRGDVSRGARRIDLQEGGRGGIRGCWIRQDPLPPAP